MTSYFSLELDTTPPVIEILTPNNASNVYSTIVRIEANEELLNWQNIYAIDGMGNVQELTFDYNNYYFEGNIEFNYKNKIITLFAQLKDSVGNVSDIVTKTIKVLETHPLVLKMDEQTQKVENAVDIRAMKSNEVTRRIYDLISERRIDIYKKDRNIELSIVKTKEDFM